MNISYTLLEADQQYEHYIHRECHLTDQQHYNHYTLKHYTCTSDTVCAMNEFIRKKLLM